MTDSLPDPLTDALPPCPACGEPYAYPQGALLVCPMCGHEWNPDTNEGETESETETEPTPDTTIRDAVGKELSDGDTVTVIRDLKIKGGGGGTVKVGTKVQNIRLIDDGVDGHDIDATVPGFGRMQLKSSVVKKLG